MSEVNCCGDCRWFRLKRNKTTLGECWFHPPVVNSLLMPDGVVHSSQYRPNVWDNDFCASFSPK